MFNIFSTLKNNASQAIGTAKSAVGGAINTANQNLQEFGGDVYDTYSTAKSAVKNTYDSGYNKLYNAGGDAYDTYAKTKSTVKNKVEKANQNLQEFGGDVYDVYAGARDARNNLLQKNAKAPTVDKGYDFGANVINSTLGKAVRGFGDYATGVGEIGKEREATQYGIDDKKALKVMKMMKDEGFSKEEIIAQMESFDSQEMARKQQEFSRKYSGENAGPVRNLLAGASNFGGGVIAGGMRLPAGIVDFASGGNSAYARDTMNAINEMSDYSASAKAGDIFGNIATTALIPTAKLAQTAIKGAPVLSSVANGIKIGGAFGALDPIMQKGSEATFGDIATGAGIGATVGGAIPFAAPIARGLTRGAAKVGGVVASPAKSVINTVKQYAGTPDEIAGIQAAIKPKQIVRGGVNLRPQKQIENEISLANSLIRGSGEKPTGLAGYRDSLKNQMVNIGDEINRLTGQDLSLSIGETAGKLRELAASESVQLFDGAGASRLLNIADELSKKKFSVSEAEEMNQFINSMLRNKNIDQSESYQRGLNIVVEGLRKGLDDTISNIPGQYKELKKAYGALRNVYGDTVAREIVDNRKALSGLYESFGAVEGLGNIASGLGKIFTGTPGAGLSDIGKGLAQNAVGRFVQNKNNPNNIIKSVFAKEGKKSYLAKIKPKEILLLPAPKAGARKSEVMAPILGKKSAQELSRESMKELNKNKNVIPSNRTNNIPMVDMAGAQKNQGKTVKPKETNITRNERIQKGYSDSAKSRWDKGEFTMKENGQATSYLKSNYKGKEYIIDGKKYIVDAIDNMNEQVRLVDSNGSIIRIKVNKLPETKVTKEDILQFYKDREQKGFKLVNNSSRPNVVSPKQSRVTPKEITESAFKNNKGFISPSEIKKSLIPKKGTDEARKFYDDLVYAGNSPIVAQRETAKRFGTIRAMSASKAGTFGGEGAKEAPKTGWFKGADGKMKFEIDDSKAKFEFPKRTSNESQIQNANSNFETAKLNDVQIKDAMEIDGFKGTPKEYRDGLIKKGYEDMYNIKRGNYRLGDILQHSDLYKQYPWLENTPVSFHTEGGMRSAGEMTNGKISIALNAKDPKSVILHEIQHIIQEKEGFATGGSIDGVMRELSTKILGLDKELSSLHNSKNYTAYDKLRKEYDSLIKIEQTAKTEPGKALEMYQSLAGEVESRNVQTRMNMTAKERALKSVESTEDVPRNKQIVRLKSDGTSMSIDKAGTMDISKAPDALVQEAKKYKSADEFIKAQGEPVYHGTKYKFDTFSKEKIGSSVGSDKEGIFFTNSKILASRYADSIDENGILKRGITMEAYPAMNNPLTIESKGAPLSYFTSNKENILKKAKKGGFDGVVVRDKVGDENIIIAFNPEQIKTQSQLKQIYEQANKK